jgi:hypothetical protein
MLKGTPEIILDKSMPKFWRKLKIGSAITLTDLQAIKESLTTNDHSLKREYIISSKASIKLEGGIGEYLLFDFADADNMRLIAKIVGEEMDIRIYFQIPEVPLGNRKDLVCKLENCWMFKPPADPDNFNPETFDFDTLELVDWASLQMDVDGNKQDVVYNKKATRTLIGRFHDTEESSSSDCLAAITEYQAESKVDNPELVIIEIGGSLDGEKEEGRQNEGGFMSILLGSNLSLSAIEIYEKA